MSKRKKNKILVADDNEEIRDLLAEAVSFPGCEVSKASDGEETLKMILKDKPDLLILDINMPKKNGFEVLRKIKGRKTTKNIYVIGVHATFMQNLTLAYCTHNYPLS